MKRKILVFLLVFTLIVKNSDSYSQTKVNSLDNVNRILDSLSGKGFIYKTTRENPDIKLTKEQALTYLQTRYRLYNWNNPGDPLRQAIGRLLFFASNKPFDSTRYFLEKYAYDSINIPWDKFYVWDTLKLKMPVIAPPEYELHADALIKADTLHNDNLIDSIKSLKPFNAPDLLSKTRYPKVELKDTIILVATDTMNDVTGSSKGFPFRYYRWPFESDSIKAAINSLIGFIETRDSSIVYLSGTSNRATPVWLNSNSEKLVRFWLHNEYFDSVTVWVGGVSRNTIGLFLEEGISFRKLTKQSNFSNARLNLKVINSKSLQEIKQIAIKPHYWKFHTESALILNQTSLSNWVKGGEGSISTAMDITGFADYDNKKKRLSSNNFVRLKYGLVKSGENPVRKNQDLLETNSKLNHKAFGKFEFSAVMLFKTQISKGYNYPNDSIPVSKFMNPATLTIGLGLDFKPNKTTSVNFSPLSYKATIVTDTVNIDQTKYGIPRDKKSMHEPGISLIITNEYKPFKQLTITNRLQLFTNYIHNPQNVDVDWEIIVTSKINWFTDVRFNAHLIFDDDTKTNIVYKNGTPVPGPDGKPQKTARIQFKEMLGFTFMFRF
jgi:hypothetical protein